MKNVSILRRGLHHFRVYGTSYRSFPGSSDGKESSVVQEIPGSGRFPGEGNGNPLQYSCLENSMDRGGLMATVHGVTKSQTQVSD